MKNETDHNSQHIWVVLEDAQSQALEESVNTERKNDNGVSETGRMSRIKLFFLLLPPLSLLQVLCFFLHFIESQFKFSLKSYWVEF